VTKIEVPGTFLFENGKVSFAFADKTVAFSDIASMDQFRAVLVAIAQHSTQKSIEQILHAGQPAPTSKQDAFTRAKEQMDRALSDSERSFREHQRKTEEALKQAEKDFEVATSTSVNTGRPTA